MELNLVVGKINCRQILFSQYLFLALKILNVYGLISKHVFQTVWLLARVYYVLLLLAIMCPFTSF